MLLHYGGFDLRDVFYTLPNADIVAEGEDPYQKATDALSTHEIDIRKARVPAVEAERRRNNEPVHY